jgi:hypothetical protein
MVANSVDQNVYEEEKKEEEKRRKGQDQIAQEPQTKPQERTEPENLSEQLTLEEAKAGAGRRIMEDSIKDPNYPKEEWKKMQHIHENPDRTQVEIHYWELIKTGERSGFKFK